MHSTLDSFSSVYTLILLKLDHWSCFGSETVFLKRRGSFFWTMMMMMVKRGNKVRALRRWHKVEVQVCVVEELGATILSYA